MTTTTITTAARKIQRDIATTPATLTSYYAEDGERIDTHETGLTYIDPADAPEEYAIDLRGGHHSQREIQAMLDGYAAWKRGDAPEGMDRAEAIGYYLQDI